jgi:hypothetical protein
VRDGDVPTNASVLFNRKSINANTVGMEWPTCRKSKRMSLDFGHDDSRPLAVDADSWDHVSDCRT